MKISSQKPAIDKAGEKVWSAKWRGQKLPRPIDIREWGPRAAYYRQFHQLWCRYLPPANGRALRFLEVGCARSVWLTYFAREWHYQVAGMDYSEIGCEMSRTILARDRVPGEIYHQDLFQSQPHQYQQFDLVFSNGVVEHFEPPEKVLIALSEYLRPAGRLITIIPNFAGWLGRLQALLGRDFLEQHVLLTKEEVQAAHQSAGFNELFCDYLIFLHLSVASPDDRWGRIGNFLFRKVLKGATMLTGWLGRTSPSLSLNPQTGSYIIYIGEKA